MRTKKEQVEVEENLLVLQEEQVVEETPSLFKSIAAFQQEVPIIHKDTLNSFGKYTYADIAKVITTITPYLKKHNLGFIQPLVGDSIRTVIFHTITGEQIESITKIPQGVQLKGMNEFQVYGSAVTYFRRYSLSSILGLVTDKDSDAGGEQIEKKETLSEERFNAALIALAEGKVSRELLLDKFSLTQSQVIKLAQI